MLVNTECYAAVSVPGSDITLSFQNAENYTPPVWPEEPGKQQQMLHLDFVAENVEAAVQQAMACGATVAPAQYMEHAKTMLDPAGHLFCICPLE